MWITVCNDGGKMNTAAVLLRRAMTISNPKSKRGRARTDDTQCAQGVREIPLHSPPAFRPQPLAPDAPKLQVEECLLDYCLVND